MMNGSGLDNKLPGSIHSSEEAYSLGKPPQRQYTLHILRPAFAREWGEVGGGEGSSLSYFLK